MRFHGKRVLVTGSSRGIGRAAAIGAAREGAAVALHSARARKAADAAVAEVEVAGGPSGGRAAGAFQADLGRWADAERLVGEAAVALGGLDALLAVAGHGSKESWNASLDAISEAQFDEVVGTDLRGNFALCRAAAAAMPERGGGAIVCVGSIPALNGDRDGILYAIAKAGVLGMTRMLARALAPRVRVNAVAFGSIATQWTGWLDEAGRRALETWIPLGRLGKPEEAARALLFLASDDASFVTGQTLIVDGGEVMR